MRTEALEIFRKRIADGTLNRVQACLRQKVFSVSLQFLASKSIAPVKRCVYRKNFKLRKIIELAEEIHIEQSVWHPA